MIGTKLAHYEITSHLGSGGMGEVYQASDSKLGRSIAIKILPEAFARDPERAARFEREARLLASLNHPHIAAIYGIEESGGRTFLVMELAAGETLAERIARGPLPVEDALAVARQIAEALEAAHDRGVIHRDLKPANIKIDPAGQVKVLDFGLAKAFAGEAAQMNLSNSPTLSMAATSAGVILGTAAYMSPEQAKGKSTDRGTDIWAFGCVLFEMLTGRTAFEGETLGEILGSVFKTEPDWSRLPPDMPPGIRRLLGRCLRKDAGLRLRDIRDARIEIHDAQYEPVAERAVVPGPSRRNERLAWASLVLLVAVAGLAATFWAIPAAPEAPEIRLEITTPPTDDPTSFAISPDGRQIAFVGNSESRAQLWLRPLDADSAQPLVGTDGATYPFWSPDSLSVGFFSEGQLKRIDINGGTVRVLANARDSLGGAWNRDGTVLFSTGNASPIRRVSASGGDVSDLTRVVAPQQAGHRFPQFLPDDRHFLYYAAGTADGRGVYVADLEGSTPRRLLDADASAVYTPSGQLLFARQATLFAQDFDLARLELVGSPHPVAPDVVVGRGYAAATVSATGTIVYRNGVSDGRRRQFAWFDRSGNRLNTVGDFDNGAINPSMSPDGRFVAVHRSVSGNTDIWLLELDRGLFRRLTLAPGLDILPVWSRDGRRIAFASNREGQFDLYSRLADGTGGDEILLATSEAKIAQDWSPDGRVLLYRNTGAEDALDLWALPAAEGLKPFPVTQTDFNEKDAQISTDGNWIAYQSNESGRYEIYVQPLAGGSKSQVSINGGAQVRWRRDGKELFYIGLDNRLTAVPIQLNSPALNVEAGAPVPLFATRIGGAILGADSQQYVVSADGERFLMNTVVEEAAAPLTVILNWKPGTPGQK